MKVEVLIPFRDKVDHKTWYATGDILDMRDEERANTLIRRNICKKYPGRRKPVAIVGNYVEEG